MKKGVKTLLACLLVTSVWTSPVMGADINNSINDSPPSITHEYVDLTSHWARKPIVEWSNQGVVTGTGNSLFEPNRPITRSEWAALLNRTFQIRSDASVSFSDVSEKDWYAKAVIDAVYSGYMRGFEDGTFRPKQELSREEAAVTINKLLKLEGTSEITKFKDHTSLHDWSEAEVNTVSTAGIIQGYEDGTFQPQKALSRAEAIVILDRAVKKYGIWYGEAGIYGPENGITKHSGSVIINKPGVTLQNTEILGDLIIGENVGDGDVFLKNVKVLGQTYVYGGGENSVHIDNSVLVSIIVDKVGGAVRLVAEGATTIKEVKIQTGAALDVSHGASVDRIVLTDQLPALSKVSLSGYLGTVNVEAFNIRINIPKGSVQNLNVIGSDAVIETGEESSILSLVLNAAANVIGLGSIEEAIVNSEGVSFETRPKTIETGSKVDSSVGITIGGAITTADAQSKNSSNISGGGGSTGGSGSGSSNSRDRDKDKSGNGTQPVGETPSTPVGPEEFRIQVNKEIVTIGEDVYVTSSRAGTAYFSSGEVVDYDSIPILDIAVQSGDAQKLSIKAGETVTFSTYNIKGWEYPWNFEYYVVVFDDKGNYIKRDVALLDETEPLDHSPVRSRYLRATPIYFSLNYNRIIHLNTGRSTEEIIEWSKENEPFLPFTSSDGTVEIKGYQVFIKPKHLESRTNYRFRILADSVVTKDGEVNEVFRIGPYRVPTVATIEYPEGQQEPSKIKMGETLVFTLSDSAEYVYLIPEALNGYAGEYDNAVRENWAKKVITANEPVGVPISISTEGLPAGKYSLVIQNGLSKKIEIVE